MNDLPEFRELGLSENTLNALRAKGFEKPTAIQQLTIPLLLAGECDLIGQAQTGTGKTAAFALPILETVHPTGKPQALILAPTRELSIQIADEIRSLAAGTGVRILPFYGGQPIEIQLRNLHADGVDLAVGTPGRILDLMRRGELDFSAIRFAVLDEADEMLDMGFIEEIEAILAQTSPDKRMLMFSATMPDGIRRIAEKFMRNCRMLRAEPEPIRADRTEQLCYVVRREEKFETLTRLLFLKPELYALIFCRTRVDVDELTESLNRRGLHAEALHGEIAQLQRTRVIRRFKERKCRLLVATDVAARGIDVNDLECVVNYSLPQSAETYIHRIGRTGRAGKNGTAITFVTPGELRKLRQIQHEAKTELRRVEPPGAAELVAAGKQRFAEQLAAMLDSGRHEPYLNFAHELLTLAETPAEVIAAMLRLRFRDELLDSAYPPLGAPKRERNSREKEAETDDRTFTRIYIGVGKLDGFGAVRMLDFLWSRARIRKNRVGSIDCFDRFSFVDMEPEDADRLMRRCRETGPRVRLAVDLPDNAAAVQAERAPRPERKAPAGRPRRAGSGLREWVTSLEEAAPRPRKPKKHREN